MLSKCFNPDCSERFHRLGTGTLVSLEELMRRSHSVTEKEPRTEYFWLCPRCSLTFALDFDPRTEAVALKPKLWYIARAS